MTDQARARHRLMQTVREAALEAVEPGQAIRQAVQRQGDRLLVAGRRYDLNQFERIRLVGGGKAAVPMVRALVDILGERLDPRCSGLVVTKYGHAAQAEPRAGVSVHEAGHPVPDEAGVQGARRLAELVQEAGPNDLILCPISGGGSALLTLPAPGIRLADLQALTEQLLRAGATINELNAVRKHLSQLKGGGLARMAAPATVISLILSDVVGDPLDVIASGPTAPDPTTYAEAWAVLGRHDLLAQTPRPIRERLREGRAGAIAETPKPGAPIFDAVQNVIVGSNRRAAEAAVAKARAQGLETLLLSTFVEGEAREVARVAAALAKEVARHERPVARPACLVWGGETTVTVRGEGQGGRNQELALAAALALEGWPDVALMALATDGTDGPTDAAGALVTGETVSRARELGLEAADYLARNDSYHFFQRLDRLSKGAKGNQIITGPTQTNVNDLLFIFLF